MTKTLPPRVDLPVRTQDLLVAAGEGAQRVGVVEPVEGQPLHGRRRSAGAVREGGAGGARAAAAVELEDPFQSGHLERVGGRLGEVDAGRRVEVERAGRARHAAAVVVPLARGVELLEGVLDHLHAGQPRRAAVAERSLLAAAREDVVLAPPLRDMHAVQIGRLRRGRLVRPAVAARRRIAGVAAVRDGRVLVVGVARHVLALPVQEEDAGEPIRLAAGTRSAGHPRRGLAVVERRAPERARRNGGLHDAVLVGGPGQAVQRHAAAERGGRAAAGVGDRRRLAPRVRRREREGLADVVRSAADEHGDGLASPVAIAANRGLRGGERLERLVLRAGVGVVAVGGDVEDVAARRRAPAAGREHR